MKGVMIIRVNLLEELGGDLPFSNLKKEGEKLYIIKKNIKNYIDKLLLQPWLSPFLKITRDRSVSRESPASCGGGGGGVNRYGPTHDVSDLSDVY